MLYIYTIQNTVLSPDLSKMFVFISLWLSVGAGTCQYSGVFSVTPCFQHVFPLFLFRHTGITESVFVGERCEVFVLKEQQKRTGRVRNRGV